MEKNETKINYLPLSIKRPFSQLYDDRISSWEAENIQAGSVFVKGFFIEAMGKNICFSCFPLFQGLK